MKAKQLADFLLQHPNAEVVSEHYIGHTAIVNLDHVELFQKGRILPSVNTSYAVSVTNNGKCNTDVIYISHESK